MYETITTFLSELQNADFGTWKGGRSKEETFIRSRATSKLNLNYPKKPDSLVHWYSVKPSIECNTELLRNT